MFHLHHLFLLFVYIGFSLNPYPAVPTVESSIGRTPIGDNAVGENAKVYSTYDPSSQLKYSANKYAVAENIQSALRQQSAYAQVYFGEKKARENNTDKSMNLNAEVQRIFHK